MARGIACVLDEHNCEYSILRRGAQSLPPGLTRWRLQLGWRKFAKWEAGVCRRFDCVTMVSKNDARSMLCAAPDLTSITVVPNGVDTDHYNVAQRAPESHALVYNGALTYGANLDAVRHFAQAIYPVLEQRLPGVRLRVTGRTDGVDLGGIEDCPGIELTGYVEDIRAVLEKSAACIVPLRQGGGSRLKILEAMAAGVPVVATSVGAEGIDAVHGEQILIADTSLGFAECIEQALTDDALAAKLARNARRLVEEQYSWTKIGSLFVDVVEKVESGKRKAPSPCGGNDKPR